MAKSSKLVAAKRGRVLLVRRKRDGLWMLPGGRKRARESDKDCLRREIKEELPKLKLGRLRLWKEVKAKNRRSGRKMSDAIFVTAKASGRLTIGDRKEIDKVRWTHPEPTPDDGLPPWQVTSGRVMHYVLYAVLMVIPLLGWMNASYRGLAVSFFGIITLPQLIATRTPEFAWTGDAHIIAAYYI